jgi:hypothetical protein
METSVHVFIGRFSDDKEVYDYTEATWEGNPEPDETASDEEYEAWEERNPRWPLRSELTEYLDSDFIETIVGPDRWTYLGTVLGNTDEAKRIAALVPDANALVLISKEALGGFDATMKSTPKLTYCGEYAITL